MEINRVRWAIRRGMLELDLIFQPFLENIYPSLCQSDQDLFVKLLECEDQDLFRWLMKSEQPEEADLKKILTIILDNTGLKVD